MQAVKLVKSPGLWRGLCLSAIRSRRHQVVHFCLDNMEDAQCAQAARCLCLSLCLSVCLCRMMLFSLHDVVVCVVWEGESEKGVRDVGGRGEWEGSGSSEGRMV